MSRHWFDHHPPCPGGCNQLADECACPRPNPLGSMRVEPPIGSANAFERAAQARARRTQHEDWHYWMESK